MPTSIRVAEGLTAGGGAPLLLLAGPDVIESEGHVLRMAKALAAKGYRYQFVFARNAGHCDGAVKRQTLPAALEYVCQGYPIAGDRARQQTR